MTDTTTQVKRVQYHTCDYDKCGGTVSSDKAVRYAGGTYHRGCAEHFILKSIRATIHEVPERALKMNLRFKLHRRVS